jgi:DNA-binding NarL/FixJ family response regulator
MSIYVIDDHPLMPGADVVELSQVGKLAEAIKNRGEPELFCLDLKLPDTFGVSGVQEIKTRYPDVPLAVISASPSTDFEELCLEAGADVYIEKSSGAGEISAALRILLNPEGSAEDNEPVGSGETKLSKRQKQLLVMLDQGLSNRDTADQLGISEHTVKVHLWRLFRRLGVKSRTQAVHFARTNGLLSQ